MVRRDIERYGQWERDIEQLTPRFTVLIRHLHSSLVRDSPDIAGRVMTCCSCRLSLFQTLTDLSSPEETRVPSLRAMTE